MKPPVRYGRLGFGGRASCPVAKCGPSWPAPRAVHAASSSRPSPLHRGTRVKGSKQKLPRQGLPRSALPGSPPGRGEQVEEKPEGSRAGCARVCRQYTDVLPANPGTCSRSRRGMDAPATATSRVHFFGYFLCASKESDSPARDGGRSPTGTNAASVRCARKKAKALGPRLRGDDE